MLGKSVRMWDTFRQRWAEQQETESDEQKQHGNKATQGQATRKQQQQKATAQQAPAKQKSCCLPAPAFGYIWKATKIVTFAVNPI